MTTLALLKLIVEVAIISLGAYAIYREKDLVKFERKVARYVKAFCKALYCTIRDKKKTVKSENIVEYKRNDEYEEMLKSLNKSSRIDDVLVA
jgi:hypothetical protein